MFINMTNITLLKRIYLNPVLDCFILDKKEVWEHIVNLKESQFRIVKMTQSEVSKNWTSLDFDHSLRH